MSTQTPPSCRSHFDGMQSYSVFCACPARSNEAEAEALVENAEFIDYDLLQNARRRALNW
jgi:hypothetical protein